MKDYKEIIVALTARLNERDDAILQLQDDLNALEQIHAQ